MEQLLCPVPAGEQRITLHGVSWETFEQLLIELGQTRGVRLAYDRGVLEIMSPLALHEYAKKLLARLIEAWGDENGLPLEGLGSWTMRDRTLEKGIEPDECYCIGRRLRRGEDGKIDASAMMPPDLVVEIDITSSSSVRLPIYRALGVSEVWQWRGWGVRVLHLRGDEYVEADESRVLSGFPVEQLAALIELGLNEGQSTMIRTFREQIREG
jgi:Uma2 family endonuclease